MISLYHNKINGLLKECKESVKVSYEFGELCAADLFHHGMDRKRSECRDFTSEYQIQI